MSTCRLLLVILVALLGAGCRPSGPNVLLLSVDSLRADAVTESTAPVLHGFGNEAVRYTDAVAAAPWTTPSMMSVMTGLVAPAHGVDEHDRALGVGVETLAERFRGAGYRTAGFVPEVTLRAAFGFDRGFEIFDEARYGHQRLSSPEMTGRVLQQIEAWHDEPFFIWAHLWDPHYNYTPPDVLSGEFARGARPDSEDVQCLKWRHRPVTTDEALWLRGQQDAEVRYTDKHVGQILEFLESRGLSERTVVILLSDHGEAFLEHGWLGHTNRVDEVLVHVPLMLRAPGLAPARVEGPVSLAALGRTLLGLAGLPRDDFGLEPALPLSGAASEARLVLAETRRRGCLTAAREGDLKLVVEHSTCRAELYDLARDPDESHDLALERPEAAQRLLSRLAESVREIDDADVPVGRLDPGEVPELDDALTSLGYLPSSPSEEEAVDVDPCGGAAGELPRDTFGDAILDRTCPAEGVRACLPLSS